MTKEEFAEKWGMTHTRHTPFTEPEAHEQETVIDEKFLSDLNEVIRGELIKYERYAGAEYGTLKDTEEFVDEYLKTNQK